VQKYTKDDLINLEKKHEFLVGIDSDGCVFDTMEVKQKNHFHPLILSVWGLEEIESEVRQAAEFVNLFSKWRGSNRFPALLKMFELLQAWPEAAADGVELPDTTALADYCNSGLPLGNPSLQHEVDRLGDPELELVLQWSLAVNADIAGNMEEIPPFTGVGKSLEVMGAKADLLVVSQTPEEALVNEWALHGLTGHVRAIAGQELGTKAEHLKMAQGDRYPSGKILMIGDAPGDRKAAEAVGAHFYPINPGKEAASWERLYTEAFDKFLDGSFAGAYQRELVEAFEALLPETPPWQ
jgi:phosphoglycolate phosphatase-like HAD superfamily hydrolase